MGGPEGGNPVGQLHIAETVTDHAGRYYFPAWGPRFAFRGTLKSQSPGLLFFKPGYQYRSLDNAWYVGRDASKSDRHGKTTTINPYKGTPVEYAKHLQSLNDTLWGVGYAWGERCGWKSFPRMLRAIATQDAEFSRAGVVHASVASNLRANDSLLLVAG